MKKLIDMHIVVLIFICQFKYILTTNYYKKFNNVYAIWGEILKSLSQDSFILLKIMENHKGLFLCVLYLSMFNILEIKTKILIFNLIC